MKIIKVVKRIAYCYPTSPRAGELGCYKTGGYFVEQQMLCEDNSWSRPYAAHGCGDEAFASATDPDLLALFNEADGEAA